MRGDHAGTYSCLANNTIGDSAEVTALLVVTGLVPRFTQSPVSYIEMEPLADVYLNTDIEIDFRPEAANGEFSLLQIQSAAVSCAEYRSIGCVKHALVARCAEAGNHHHIIT